MRRGFKSCRPGTDADGLSGLAQRAWACAEALERTYGAVEPRREDPLDVLVWTVLSQNTSDRNSENAFRRLKQRFPTWDEAAEASRAAIADAIRPGGLADVKAGYIKAILEKIRADSGAGGSDGRGMGLDYLAHKDRREVESYLTSLPGVGPKTAACVALFGLGMPSLPVDTHVLRLARRLGFVEPKASAATAQKVLETVVPEGLQGRLHLGLIAHGRAVCRPSRPRCHVCALSPLCFAPPEGRPGVRSQAQAQEQGESRTGPGGESRTGPAEESGTSSWSYEQAAAYIEGLARFGSRPGLSRTRRLLAALGNPEQSVNVVHVAGTNGKGSVCALLEAMALARGVTTGMYTSPHLTDFTERIRINGTPVAGDVFAAAAQRVAAVCPTLPEHPTQFEVLTAMAFDVMRRAGVELAVVEVGLGGRYDATNVVKPLVSVIASISLDHTEVLGDTLASIARDKAGIIKPGVPVVAAFDRAPLGGDDPTVDDPAGQIEAAADSRGSQLTWVVDAVGPGDGIVGENPGTPAARPLVRFRRDKILRRGGVPAGQVVTVEGPGWRMERLAMRLFGLHQAENCAVAVAALRTAFPDWPEEAIREGVKTARWSGRFEVGTAGRTIVVLDGAHNVEGAVALRRALDDAFPRSTPLVAVIGLSKDKPAPLMVRQIVDGRASVVVATRAAKSRMGAVDPDEIGSLVRAVCRPADGGGTPTILVEPSVSEAVVVALRVASELGERAVVNAAAPARRATPTRPVVCVCGSLYVVGEARRAMIEGGLVIFQ